MNDDNEARQKYYTLLDEMATLVSKARNDQTGFVSSALALMKLQKMIDPAMDKLIAWEDIERHRREQEQAIADVENVQPDVRPVGGVRRHREGDA